MENSEHVSVDMENLADFFSGQLETLLPLSGECSIYRVQEPKRGLHPSDYTPLVVSIGPLHHGKEELKAMEENKKRYLKCFLQRTKVRMARFLAIIKESEAKLRNCYAETIHLESDEFVTMVLVDAVFLIELFLRNYEPDSITDDDIIFGKSDLLPGDMRYDLWRLENQLPLFILRDLFNLVKTATHMGELYEKISFEAITLSYFSDFIIPYLPMEENVLKIKFSKGKHFLDLIILGLQPSQLPAPTELEDPKVPGVKTLHQAGIKFKSGSNKDLLDINFNNGTLEIPFIPVYSTSESLYRNHRYKSYFSDYIIMMRFLVSTPNDAEILIQNEILGVVNSESLTKFFDSLGTGLILTFDEFRYSGVVAALQGHCRFPRNKWKATLKQNYFNTPWASISVIAAVLLLLLTITQTVCNLIAL